jgi:REP-associated tyrosine transposase
MVIGRHRFEVEYVINQLKGYATRQLVAENLHPFNGRRSCWGRGDWKVFFLNTADHIRQAIRYVERNPLKDGLPPQRWRFVRPYSV